MNQASSFSLISMTVLALLVGFGELLGAVGTGAFLASFLFVAGAILTGYFLGSGGIGNRSVTALGAGQRNISAALLVATTNFSDPEVILMVLVGSMVGMGILFVAAGFFGKRSGAQPAAPRLKKAPAR
jgi:BASS family bile acid:Na+ symporter